MHIGTNQSKKINEKWVTGGIGALLFVMMLPSVLLLAKIAIGLIMTAIAIIAVKISSKAISNVLEDKGADQNQAAQQTTQNKIMNLIIGLASIFVGVLSLLIIAKIGLIATCAAVTALVLHEYVKGENIGEDKDIGKKINDKFDEIANKTTELIVSGIEKLIPSQSHEAQ